MAINFDDCALVGIVNPNTHCTQINYISRDDLDIPQKSLILFDSQIKYIEIEEHVSFKGVKIYVRGEE
jgi:hypothetical protein